MPVAPKMFRPRGAPKPDEARKAFDERRGSAASRGYDGRWAKARRCYLAAHPICEYCEMDGNVDLDSAATVVDHLYPHRVYDADRSRGLFWRSDLWVASCKACHDGMKQRVEAMGTAAIDTLARRLGRPTLTHAGGVPESSHAHA